ncbi:putative apoptosis-inducing factor [Aspergillus cavernicola]|uniref:Apoptosis-inducing factor n=1 Tax=Aspergillus cavernicola TaxID=176166 RepID=A0ABR4IBJ1_9EURO
MTHIVIVGGSHAAISTAHQILKQASKTQSLSRVKITMVSRDTHFYWNIASPRAVASAAVVPDTDIFAPIKDGFKKYSDKEFEFVLGEVVGVDVSGKVLGVAGGAGGSNTNGTETERVNGNRTKKSSEREISYDTLILCTGSDTKVATPFKSRGSTEATKEALHALQASIKAAKTILVVGGGSTGVETAGELAFEYKDKKKIILATSTAHVLPGCPLSVSTNAESLLRSLNVGLRLKTTVKTENPLPGGGYQITFSNGEILPVDMYIPTFGIVPNTSFLPAKFLDSQGFVEVDEYLAVRGAKDVYAVGDVSNAEPSQALFVNFQSKYLAKSMGLVISGRRDAVRPYKRSGTAMIGVQIGRKAGTGHYGSVKLPGFLITRLRKTLFVESLPKTVDGSVF